MFFGMVPHDDLASSAGFLAGIAVRFRHEMRSRRPAIFLIHGRFTCNNERSRLELGANLLAAGLRVYLARNLLVAVDCSLEGEGPTGHPHRFSQ